VQLINNVVKLDGQGRIDAAIHYAVAAGSVSSIKEL
jgi:hypothetical protein